MPVRPEILARNRRKPIIFDDGSLDHRGMIIRAACDLETDLVTLLAGHLVQTHALAPDSAHGEFDDWGLKRLADLAFYMSLISHEDRHDIRLLGKLRDRYAHDRQRRQLDGDDEMFRLVSSTHIYRSSEELAPLDRQQAFLCVSRELAARIKDATV